MIFTFPIDGGRHRPGAWPRQSRQIADDGSDLLRLGARPAALDGAPGLLLARSGLAHRVLEQWFIVRGPAFYLVTLYRFARMAPGFALPRERIYLMLRSWRWTS